MDSTAGWIKVVTSEDNMARLNLSRARIYRCHLTATETWVVEVDGRQVGLASTLQGARVVADRAIERMS